MRKVSTKKYHTLFQYKSLTQTLKPADSEELTINYKAVHITKAVQT